MSDALGAVATPEQDMPDVLTGHVTVPSLAAWMLVLACAGVAAGAGACQWHGGRWTGIVAAAWLIVTASTVLHRWRGPHRLRASEHRVLTLRDDLAGWALMVTVVAGATLAPWPFTSLAWVIRVIAGMMALQALRVLLRSAGWMWRRERPVACLRIDTDRRVSIAITGLVPADTLQATLTLFALAGSQNEEGRLVARPVADVPACACEGAPGDYRLQFGSSPKEMTALFAQTSRWWVFGKLGTPDYLLARLDVASMGQSWRFEWR